MSMVFCPLVLDMWLIFFVFTPCGILIGLIIGAFVKSHKIDGIVKSPT